MIRKKSISISVMACFSFAASVFFSCATLANESNIPIADKVEDNFSLLQTGGRTESGALKTIQRSGASFIKVHFKSFQLPEGVFVEISNPKGTEVFRYGQTVRSPYTFDAAAGEDGTSRFSSMSVSGDTVLIKLLTNGISLDPQQHSLDIDYFMQGYTNQRIDELLRNSQDEQFDGARLESICGGDEREDAVCYQNSHPVEFERTRPVARLLINGNNLCTAWRVSEENRLFTNNHCAASQADVQNTEVWFNFQNTACGGTETAPTTKVTGATLLRTDFALDYTLFTVDDFASVQSFGFFGLDPRIPDLGEEIFIPQHGAGNPKELAIESDQNAGSACQIDAPSTSGRARNSDVGYFCDTVGGSSGSPVVSKKSNKVIAIHHFGGCLNQGVQMARIWPQVAGFFTALPDNDSDRGPLSGEAPEASFNHTSTGLTARFSNASKDSDGTIVSFSWEFGDGETSSASTPIHTYGSAGTYTVTLTITDNDGQTDAVNQQITVTDNRGEVATLRSGETLENLSAPEREFIFYRLSVPSGAADVQIEIAGGSGDVDLYARRGDLPSTSVYDCRPFTNGNNESCIFSSAGAGDYFIGLRAYSGFDGVNLSARVGTNLTGQQINRQNLSSEQGQWQMFTIDVEPGTSSLQVTMTGQRGDADLYLNPGAEPNTSVYQCRPFKNSSNESCVVNQPRSGIWYVGVRAYSNYSAVNLTVTAR